MTEIKAGHLYKGPRRQEQSQGWYVPVMDGNGRLALIDTYFIKGRYSAHDKNVSAMTEAIVEMGSEPHPYTFSHIRGNYYYGKDGIHYFDKLPDSYEDMGYLPDFKYVGRSESRDYDPSDVIEYVQLYFEHGFNWHGYVHGVFLVRKGAEKVRTRVLLAAMEDVSDSINRPYLTTYKLSEAKRIHDSMAEVPPEVESRYADLIERCELIERMGREYQELLEQQRERRANEQVQGDH